MVPTELLFDIKEFGCRDWGDRKANPVGGPSEVKNSTFHDLRNRAIRHQTSICWIAAGGDAYYLLLISSDAIVRQVFEQGLRQGIDLGTEIELFAYVRAEVFDGYYNPVLSSAVELNGQIEECGNKPVILFCDNCTAHHSENLFDKMARHGIVIRTNPTYTFRLFEALDTLPFAVIKHVKNTNE
jgi:hypothetical protein